MPSMGTLKDPSFGQHFRVMVLCTVLLQMLLQTLSMAVTYVYFTNQMKQLQNKHFRSGLDCLLEEDEDSWSPTEEEIRHCLQTKKQLYQLIEEVTLRTVEETMTTVQEKQLSIPFPPRSRKPQRVAAHITGISRRSSSALTLNMAHSSIPDQPPCGCTSHSDWHGLYGSDALGNQHGYKWWPRFLSSALPSMVSGTTDINTDLVVVGSWTRHGPRQ
ncbi:tumor necrosis factor ligand superfamily member 10-like protein [Cricetulus griseus]|nr:tumor necrosis factor ligand superfamily member 10-like protein [Cricetulus griseus]